ncbi:MAG: site-specific DNA-methyltransferase, partial [Alphaproteobacteria bacterium]|nr:site-specific DNA-methyltransferase [Alphaproteobacteria bacterium]
DVYKRQDEDLDGFYILNGEGMVFYEGRLVDIDGSKLPGEILTDVWTDIGWTGIANEGGVQFKNGKKPERLVRRCLEMATSEGDLVLDSFCGSGTTAAVAHKMGRKWIAVELADHCHTHIIPRMKRVIDGDDRTGISRSVNWKGGGGFRYYRLAPSMLEKDKWGNWIISREYNACMLAEAMCGHMGFTYAPDKTLYWIHGRSTETDFIYVTTRMLTYEQLRVISEEVGSNRTLLICCKAFNAKAGDFDNLTLRKIPQAVLRRCEWGKDDYSLSIADLDPAGDAGEESEDA